jgi:BASS family bile acid:Na+ symporter
LLAVAMAFVFNLLLQAAGWIAFRGLGAVTALTVALMAGNCNMGLVLVALSGHVEVEVTAFFALAQVADVHAAGAARAAVSVGARPRRG